MSKAAEAWFFDECEIRGSEGWVLLLLCDYTDDDGFSGLSKKTLSTKSRLGITTVVRALRWLEAELVITPATSTRGPAWWVSIPANRRPTLYEMTRFLGSRFGTPEAPGVPQGYQTRAPGVPQGYHDTPSELPKQNAMVDE